MLDDAGHVMPLAGYTGRAHLRNAKGELLQTFTVTIAADELAVYASYGDTELWPIGQHTMNLEITNGLDRRSSEILQIDVTRDPTR